MIRQTNVPPVFAPPAHWLVLDGSGGDRRLERRYSGKPLRRVKDIILTLRDIEGGRRQADARQLSRLEWEVKYALELAHLESSGLPASFRLRQIATYVAAFAVVLALIIVPAFLIRDVPEWIGAISRVPSLIAFLGLPVLAGRSLRKPRVGARIEYIRHVARLVVEAKSRLKGI